MELEPQLWLFLPPGPLSSDGLMKPEAVMPRGLGWRRQFPSKAVSTSTTWRLWRFRCCSGASCVTHSTRKETPILVSAAVLGEPGRESCGPGWRQMQLSVCTLYDTACPLGSLIAETQPTFFSLKTAHKHPMAAAWPSVSLVGCAVEPPLPACPPLLAPASGPGLQVTAPCPYSHLWPVKGLQH